MGYTIKYLLERKAANATALAEAKQNIAEIDDEIEKIVGHNRKAALLALGKDTGTCRFEVDAYKVKAVTDKKVDWDQDALETAWDTIAASDAGDPREYIKRKFDVSEAAYKAWPKFIKEQFTGARAVTPGKVKYEFTEKAAG